MSRAAKAYHMLYAQIQNYYQFATTSYHSQKKLQSFAEDLQFFAIIDALDRHICHILWLLDDP